MNRYYENGRLQPQPDEDGGFDLEYLMWLEQQEQQEEDEYSCEASCEYWDDDDHDM